MLFFDHQKMGNRGYAPIRKSLTAHKLGACSGSPYYFPTSGNSPDVTLFFQKSFREHLLYGLFSFDVVQLVSRRSLELRMPYTTHVTAEGLWCSSNTSPKFASSATRFPLRGPTLEELTDKSSHYYFACCSASLGFVFFFKVLNNMKKKTLMTYPYRRSTLRTSQHLPTRVCLTGPCCGLTASNAFPTAPPASLGACPCGSQSSATSSQMVTRTRRSLRCLEGTNHTDVYTSQPTSRRKLLPVQRTAGQNAMVPLDQCY